jgi:lipoprotein-anchoring transpeptidase ErfK/SrfK
MRKIALIPLFLLPLFLLAASPAAADPWGDARTPRPAGTQVIYSARDTAPATRGRHPQRRQAGAPDFAPGSQRLAANETGSLGGGFIEFLFTGRSGTTQSRDLPRSYYQRPWEEIAPGGRDEPGAREARPRFDPRFERRVVDYPTKEKAGTIVIDTPNKYLYLVQEEGKAIRYGVGVGRPGFEWAGVKQVTQKREWPDWIPPKEMLQRRPDLPTHMAGGPDNPLGARAIYLGSSLYRIHGSNEPHTIGQAVSSGCIRMRNPDVIDLYEKVKIGTRVIVI